MKILYFCMDPGIPLHGRKGCSTHVRETVHALEKLGHQTRIVCSNTEGDEARENGLDVVTIAPWRSRKLGFDVRAMMLNHRALGRLEREIAAWRPDAIYERYSLYCRAGQAVAQWFGLPRILEVNAFLTREQAERIRVGWLARHVERQVIAAAQRVVVVSSPLAEEVVRLGVAPERVSRMPMAVDLDKFSPSIDGESVRRRHDLQGRFVIGYVGTLAGWHGIRLIHDLALELRRRQAPPFVFLIVGGEGEKLETNRFKSAESGLADALRFVGSVEHAEVPRHVRAFDAALVPDMTYWSSPAKLFEYQASGVPVVAPDYPAIFAAMDDGQEGIIFPARSIEAMADALLKLMNDPAARERMGQAARRRAEADHSWEFNAKAIVSMFEEMRGEK